MTERPILFKPDMVRAILAGKKTQTRRLIPADLHLEALPGDSLAAWRIKRWVSKTRGPMMSATKVWPYGWARDWLWVRESLQLEADGWHYAADGAHVGANFYQDDTRVDDLVAWAARRQGKACPSLHMPRWASRLTLEVKSVRVERLHDISESDARAEGVEGREAFRALWDRINGKRAPWKKNPWLWVVEFRRLP